MSRVTCSDLLWHLCEQAGTLTKEREAKLLDMGFIFDGKQAQAVRDEYEAARQQEQQLSSGAEDDWEEGLSRLREYQALHGHACPRDKDRKGDKLARKSERFARRQREDFKVSHCFATPLKPTLLSRLWVVPSLPS